MSNRKASLIYYGNVPNVGWRRGTLVKSANGKFKHGSMRYKKQVVQCTAGVYQIRSYDGRKPIVKALGSDLDLALSAFKQFSKKLQLENLTADLGISLPGEQVKERKRLAQYASDYIKLKKNPSLELGVDSIALYEATIKEFVTVANKLMAEDITEDEVLAYCNVLQARGLSDRTRTTRYVAVRGFMYYMGIDPEKIISKAVHKKLYKKPDAHTDPYTDAEIDKILGACTAYYRMVFTMLLSTGMRMREAMHLTWHNIKWDDDEIFIPSEQTINHSGSGKVVKFSTKTGKGRKVPLFQSLKTALQGWHKQNPDTIYVLGTLRSDLPNNHWLPYLKQFAKDAGLNCGVCDT